MGVLKNIISMGLSVFLTALVLVVVIDGPQSEWRFSSIPNQAGKVVVVTGANAGIGFHFSRHMASKGATVVMACRDTFKCKKAKEAILKDHPNAILATFDLDLARQSSIINFVDEFKQKYKRLDILVNNAGIMAVNHNLTVDGFEQHIAVNHLGHFTLTAQLYPLLSSTSYTPNPITGVTETSRIISVSSLVERASLLSNIIDYNDLHWKHRPYNSNGAYQASKIANIQFMRELHSRISKKKSVPEVLSVGAHPGFSFTELQQKTELPQSIKDTLVTVTATIAQSAEMGAAPLLYAATAKNILGGKYYGPGQALGLLGWPKEAWLNPVNLNEVNQAKLWELSEQMTKSKIL